MNEHMNDATSSQKTAKTWSLKKQAVAAVIAGAVLVGVAIPSAIAASGSDASESAAQQVEQPADGQPGRAGQPGQAGQGADPLEALVSEGVISAEQADAIKSAVEPVRQDTSLARDDKRAAIESVIEELVDDGVITEAQLDALEQARPQGGPGGPQQTGSQGQAAGA